MEFEEQVSNISLNSIEVQIYVALTRAGYERI